MERENSLLHFIVDLHFSQFHWLDPLQRKYPHAAPDLDEIFSAHRSRDRPQSDHGGEFKKEVIKVAIIFLLP